MADMAKTEILPSIYSYTSELASGVKTKNDLGVPCASEKDILIKLSNSSDAIYETVTRLDDAVARMNSFTDSRVLSEYCKDVLLPIMEELREKADEAEPYIPESHKPFPSYGELLFEI